MLFSIALPPLLVGCYAVVFLLAFFVPPEFLAVAFDSGGVTTGPMTVPFIMALGVGISAIRSDRHAADDSFGLVALSSIGPILAVVILGIIAVLLYLEPHMSATLIILALGFILMTLGGTDWKYLVGLVILGCLLVAVYLLTKGYTGGRISAWLHPENDPLDKGLQVLQAQYAIGSGGLLGLGFGRGRQKYLYLPEEHNDYIFAIACEELGFVGAIGILILFALLIIRGYWIAMHARDRFSLLLAAGLTTRLALQVFLNVAVVTNLLPSTGISLPFFSYGGTALIMQLAENGIVLNVSRSITQSPR